MIGLDTNILLRLFLKDDPEQCKLVEDLVEKLPEIGPGYINRITLMEFVWFLRRRSGLTRDDIMDGVAGLLDSADIVVEDEQVVEETLDVMRNSKVEFADAFIALRNREMGCRATKTFDKTAARAIPGMELLT
ncbi:nucleic-acid-binding protein [Metarhizobium album]|uniref:Nucleic-acid-binding protein n=1 Tax=Metarhizobium album TaxID=2182425 RepID=A0A2U2DV41_9HYPH|nr:type II toxin-antitoxin system VapC family toxin [Rhizobium album]PWE57193.1 nucleic-acid-binding protein [Rhizobium album]